MLLAAVVAAIGLGVAATSFAQDVGQATAAQHAA